MSVVQREGVVGGGAGVSYARAAARRARKEALYIPVEPTRRIKEFALPALSPHGAPTVRVVKISTVTYRLDPNCPRSQLRKDRA